MAILGSPNYRVGLIVARAQPFHNGHLKIITDALMMCDEVIFSIRGYDNSFFDYNFAQKLYRKLFNLVDRVAFFGTEFDPTLGTPKHHLIRTLEKLNAAIYHTPTHFFHDNDLWLDAAKEVQLNTFKIVRQPYVDSDAIIESINNSTKEWKEKVPYHLIEDIETYIATKRRNF